MMCMRYCVLWCHHLLFDVMWCVCVCDVCDVMLCVQCDLCGVCDVMWCGVWCVVLLCCDAVLCCMQWHQLPKPIHNHSLSCHYPPSPSCQNLSTSTTIVPAAICHPHPPHSRVPAAKNCSMNTKQKKQLDARKSFKTINKETAVCVSTPMLSPEI